MHPDSRTAKLLLSFREGKAFLPPKVVQVEITKDCGGTRCVMCDRWQWIYEEPTTSKVISLQKLKSLFCELAECARILTDKEC